MEGHISEATLEEYVLDKLTQPRIAQIEEHLQACEPCRARREAIEPVSLAHFTKAGPVYLRVTRLATGRVMARHWDRELDGGKDFGTVAAARRYLNRTFALMFPVHTCGPRCGPCRTVREFVRGPGDDQRQT